MNIRIKNAIYKGLNEGLDFEDNDLQIIKKSAVNTNVFHQEIELQLQEWAQNKKLNIKTFYKIWLKYGIKFPMIDDINYFSKFITKFIKSPYVKNLDVKDIDLNWIDVSAVTNMTSLFTLKHREFRAINSLDLSSWDVRRLKYADKMFEKLPIKAIYIKDWNTCSLTSTVQMFRECTILEKLDLSNWNTESLTNLGGMFQECENLKLLNLRNWNLKNADIITCMFYNCRSLSKLIMQDQKNFNNERSLKDFSNGCFNNVNPDVIPEWFHKLKRY